MRSSALVAVVAWSAAVVGCASPQDKAACHPVASWAAPVMQCGGGHAAPPPPVAIAPPPAPEPEPAKPEPPPEPPPTATLKTDKIEVSEAVQFEDDSATLTERSQLVLDDVARQLADHPEAKKVQIESYTDATGSKQRSLKLSQERAAAVKTYLVGKGVEAKRLTTKGFGEARPLASNKTDEGRAKNRRIEFRILRK